MVAYNFRREFAPSIADGTKLQTIRAPRARSRHARPGEPIQLYTGMRTKSCRKLLPDPKYVAVLPVEITKAATIVDGVQLREDQLEKFAIADGFSSIGAFLDFFAPRMPCEGYSLIAWGDWRNPLA